MTTTQENKLYSSILGRPNKVTSDKLPIKYKIAFIIWAVLVIAFLVYNSYHPVTTFDL